MVLQMSPLSLSWKCSKSSFLGVHALFSDTSLLAGKIAQVVKLGATYLTYLVDGDAFDSWRLNGEDTLHSNCA